ncbi:Peptidyl-tRNA hydrolase [compost metagenome]
MNLSGKALNYWMQTLKIPVENTLVIVDELALPFGRVQLKPKGGNAGHNGLKNIESMIGTQAYPRIRFGIGDNFPRGRQVDYVLSGFDDDESPQLPLLIDKSIEMIKAFSTIGIELAMTRLNK